MTAWVLLEVWATGDKLRAIEASKEAVIRTLGLKVGKVLDPRDLIAVGGGFKVKVDSIVYTIREVRFGDWQR